MNLRVCTFNAHQRAGGDSLDFLLRRIEPNIVLLQEAKRVAWPGAFIPLEKTAGEKERPWATGIWADDSVEVDALPGSRGTPGTSTVSGALTAALLTPPDAEPLVAVSLYAAFDNGFTITTAESLVEDLKPIIAAANGRRLIVGGDFNAWDQYADGWEKRWQAVWDQLEAQGLVNLLRQTRASRVSLEGCKCGFGDGCWHVQTVRRKSRALTDYLWTTSDLAEDCVVDVMDINDDELVGISDHSPVWADLEIRTPNKQRG